jgi:hypothetical protein
MEEEEEEEKGTNGNQKQFFTLRFFLDMSNLISNLCAMSFVQGFIFDKI